MTKREYTKVPEASQRLKELREKLSLTIRMMGREIGYSSAYISSVERSLFHATVEMLTSVCNAFNVNPDWLIKGDKKAKMFVEGSSKGSGTSGTSEAGVTGRTGEYGNARNAGGQLGRRESSHSSDAPCIPRDKIYVAKHSKVAIGKRVRQIRTESGLDQKEFGIKISLANTSVSRLELGKITITERTAKCIEKEFRVGIDWLYYGDETAKQWPVDDAMIKWIKVHPEARKKIEEWMNQ